MNQFNQLGEFVWDLYALDLNVLLHPAAIRKTHLHSKCETVLLSAGAIPPYIGL